MKSTRKIITHITFKIFVIQFATLFLKIFNYRTLKKNIELIIYLLNIIY